MPFGSPSTGEPFRVPDKGTIKVWIVDPLSEIRSFPLITSPNRFDGESFVGRARALMHEQPAQDWSMDELGRRVGLSRSALHERFIQLIGVPATQYLAQWRMQAAGRGPEVIPVMSMRQNSCHEIRISLR